MGKTVNDNNGQAVKEKVPGLKNRLEVLHYLKNQGCQIGKTKIYADSESGKLRMQPDGSILLSDVELYKKAYLSPRKKVFAMADIEILQKEKLQEEIKKLKQQTDRLAWEKEKEIGKYILRDDFEMEIVARAAVFEISLKQMVSSKIYDWISVCQGNHAQANSMADLINQCIDNVLNDYATTDRFQVIFTDKEESSLE